MSLRGGGERHGHMGEARGGRGEGGHGGRLSTRHAVVRRSCLSVAHPLTPHAQQHPSSLLLPLNQQIRRHGSPRALTPREHQRHVRRVGVRRERRPGSSSSMRPDGVARAKRAGTHSRPHALRNRPGSQWGQSGTGSLHLGICVIVQQLRQQPAHVVRPLRRGHHRLPAPDPKIQAEGEHEQGGDGRQ